MGDAAEAADGRANLSTALVGALYLAALVEARTCYPKVFEESEYDRLASGLLAEIASAVRLSWFDPLAIESSSLSLTNAELLPLLDSITAVAVVALGVEFQADLRDDPEDPRQLRFRSRMHEIRARAERICSPPIRINQKRMNELLWFDCQEPTIEFEALRGREAYSALCFAALWRLYAAYLDHRGRSPVYYVPDPFQRFATQLQVRLKRTADTTGDDALIIALDDLVQAAQVPEVEEVWEDYVHPRIAAVDRAFAGCQAANPTAHLRLTRAERGFVEAAETVLEQVRRLSNRAWERLAGKGPSEQQAKLTDAELADARRHGFKCLVPVRLTGKQGRNTRVLQVKVGDATAHVPRGHYVFLLRLALAHYEDAEGWVGLDDLDTEWWFPNGAQQALSRYRKPFESLSLDPDAKSTGESPNDLIEQDKRRVRLSLPRSMLFVEPDALFKVLDDAGRTQLLALLDAKPG